MKSLIKKDYSKICPPECIKNMRMFIGIFGLQLVTLCFILAVIGHFISIPFVPTKFIVRTPALLLYTVIYIYLYLLCKNQHNVLPFLNKKSI